MINIYDNGVYLLNGTEVLEDSPENHARLQTLNQESARRGTISYRILQAHNSAPDDSHLNLRFDALASHDITFVNIVQTARASGLERFPMPYILTNCHNSLCAVGGTINEDDHQFGLSAAIKYGGMYVPPHLAVIHSFIREMVAGSGKMILGSDSHTRYGGLGTMGVGEGGGELVKQLLGQSYSFSYPRIIAVYITGTVQPGVGPQDVALALVGAVFENAFAKNAVLEFVGPGIAALPADFRAGIDVMTTETRCWSSIWQTDAVTEDYLKTHNRAAEYKKLEPEPAAFYDGLIRIDLSGIKPMIALPFHPSNVYELDQVIENPGDILRKIEKDSLETLENPDLKLNLTGKIDHKGQIRVDQAIIAGCAGGTFDNIMAAAALLENAPHDSELSLAVYPGSQPIMLECTRNTAISTLISAGAIVRTAFCGPCFGAGDTPANNAFSIRHTTRNFPYREGSKPGDGQLASVALMDARSIAATVRNGGYLTSAQYFEKPELSHKTHKPPILDWPHPPTPFSKLAYHFDDSPYKIRVYNGIGNPQTESALRYGPNIVDWPEIPALGTHLLIKIVSFITDPVTTTDELIPSGETSSYRSNPLKLAEFTLARKDPLYVPHAKAVKNRELPELDSILNIVCKTVPAEKSDIQLGSGIFAMRPGDGSAREQAASCQRVLGGCANIAVEYATKRYRSNLINWGIIPFTTDGQPHFSNGDYIFIPTIAEQLSSGNATIPAFYIHNGKTFSLTLDNPLLNPEECAIILAGSLINYQSRMRRLISNS
ncbi:hydratase [Spirochaetia bacterium]|nr:hydratase [Spirochaetia bacterium]